MTPEQASARLSELALSLDGVTALSDPERFGRTVAPNGPPAARAYMLQVNVPKGANSPCETVGVGVLETVLGEAGCSVLQEPLTGATLEWAHATNCATACKALHSPESPGKGLRPRCVVHEESVTGRHWIVLLEKLDMNRWRALEGTLVDGVPTIRIVEVDIPGGVFDRTHGKPIANWIDCDELFGALLVDEKDPADSTVDGDASAFAAGEVA
jgi:hypothetical protein